MNEFISGFLVGVIFASLLIRFVIVYSDGGFSLPEPCHPLPPPEKVTSKAFYDVRFIGRAPSGTSCAFCAQCSLGVDVISYSWEMEGQQGTSLIPLCSECQEKLQLETLQLWQKPRY